MKNTWNLDLIYQGFKDPGYQKDLKNLENTVEQLDAFSKTLPDLDAVTGLTQGISLLEQLSELAEKLATYANLRQTADTTDPQCSSQLGRILNIFSGAAAGEAAFKAWAAKLPDLPSLVEQTGELKDYRFLFQNIADSSRHLLPGRGEEIFAKMQLSGGNAWSELQQFLTSTVTACYQGQEITLSQVRNLASHADADVRRDAYQAELACYPKIQDAVAYALNSIKQETLSECTLRGYTSPLEKTLKDSNTSRDTLDAMLAAMDEYLPKFQQYLQCKAKALGHKNGLPWYDLFAPMGSSSTQFTVEDARNYLVGLFGEFDTALSQMIADAFDHRWIDFFPRPGKAGGAFCANVRCIGQSRILTNFDGTFSSLVTLAHELGHAFHDRCIQSHRPLNHDYSMPLAETASTFNECVVMASAIKNAADDQERIALIESQLQDATQIICDIYSRYRFEAEVFRRRPDSFMDADTLCNMMLQAQKQCYGDAMNQEQLHPYMWVCKSHYYGPIFYNFPYAFGGLFARGLYAQYEKEGTAFLPKYRQLLYTTTIASAEDTAKTAGIDLTDKNFWRGALQTIADQIDLLCKLITTSEE